MIRVLQTRALPLGYVAVFNLNDSNGNRTRVTAVKGRCLNRLTMEPKTPRVGLEPTTTRLTAECSAIELLRNIESGNDIVSRAVSSQVPSARGGLTSVFGMGTGGSLQPLSPEIMYGGFACSSASSRPSLRFVSPYASALSAFTSRLPLPSHRASVPLCFLLFAFLSVRAQLFAPDSPFASAQSSRLSAH